jgi:hypothetical protein
MCPAMVSNGIFFSIKLVSNLTKRYLVGSLEMVDYWINIVLL